MALGPAPRVRTTPTTAELVPYGRGRCRRLRVREVAEPLAAIRLGRRFLGWEMNPKYAEIARKRMVMAREQLELGV